MSIEKLHNKLDQLEQISELEGVNEIDITINAYVYVNVSTVPSDTFEGQPKYERFVLTEDIGEITNDGFYTLPDWDIPNDFEVIDKLETTETIK